MHKEVATIFKVLIGTVVSVVVASVIIEMFNINTTGLMIDQYTKLAAKQSAQLFTQETYRNQAEGGSAGAINNSVIYAADGSEYSMCSDGGTVIRFNNFYNGSTEEEIWKSMYDLGADSYFRNSLLAIKLALNNRGTAYVGSIKANADLANFTGSYTSDTITARAFPEFDSLYIMASGNYYNQALNEAQLWEYKDTQIEKIKYNNDRRAESYKADMITPINLGIPYMDKNVTSRMLKWHLTQLLSNCNSGNILKNTEGYANYTAASDGDTNPYAYYVNFKGFAVFTRAAEITGYTFYALDLNSPTAQRKLNDMVHINGDSLQYNRLSNYNIDDGAARNDKASNNVVWVVEIRYKVPVTYIGITPVKNIFNYVFSHGVKGYSGSAGDNLNNMNIQYTPNTDMLNNNNMNKVSTGTLYYTLVR